MRSTWVRIILLQQYLSNPNLSRASLLITLDYCTLWIISHVPGGDSNPSKDAL